MSGLAAADMLVSKPAHMPLHQPAALTHQTCKQVTRTEGGGLKRTPSWHSFGTLEDTDTEEEADGTSVVSSAVSELQLPAILISFQLSRAVRHLAACFCLVGFVAGAVHPRAGPDPAAALSRHALHACCSWQHSLCLLLCLPDVAHCRADFYPAAIGPQLTTEAAALLGTQSVKVRRLNSGAEIIYRRLQPQAAAAADAAATSTAAATSAVAAGRGPSEQPPSRQGSGPQLNTALAPTPAASGAH